ncbi:MAG: transcription antitermination factor NusB [Propionibacteriaceae bacterium]|nr:transcription antitermination factor NusB [Propionibacteriaceae bacterium]
MAESGRYGTQTKARRVALDVLFAAELRGRGIVETFLEARDLSTITVRDLTTRIVHGVAEHLDEVDTRISAALDSSWSLGRMPAVDRNLARIAIFELDYTDTPTGVVISEAVRLAQELSTDGSPSFLNGLLSKAAATKENNS